MSHTDKNTEELLAEIARLKQEVEYLRPFEARFQLLSEHIWDYAYSYCVNEDGIREHEWTTGSFKKVTGYEPGVNLNIYHPDDMELARNDQERVQKGEVVHDEYRIVTPDGEIRWLFIHRIPIWNEGYDRIIRYLGIAQDITKRKGAESQLEDKRVELALAQKQKAWMTDLLNSLSHDLKTPLSIIETSLYLLNKNPDVDKQAEYIGKIKSQSLRLQNMVNDILALSRLDSAPMLQRDRVNMAQLIDEIAHNFQDMSGQKQQKLVLDLDTTLPPVSGDVQYLQRAIYNLVANAIRYTPDGGEIKLMYRAGDTDVVIEVVDTGIGIEKEKLPYIFEHFYRIDEARSMNTGGTGLGLAIVKKIVEMHGGQIEVDSKPSQGSCFRIYLPVEIPE